jgi:hypothetical protein
MRPTLRRRAFSDESVNLGPAQTVFALALPALVAAGPILYLWSRNAAAVDPRDVVPLIFATLTITVALVAAIGFLTLTPIRAALTVTLLWLPVLTFGYQTAFVQANFPDLAETAETFVAIVNVAIVAALMRPVWRRDVSRTAAFLGVAAAIFCVMTFPGIFAHVSVRGAPERPTTEGATDGPDIYFIILDGYGRADVLAEMYQHDNRPFLDALRSRGLVVADASYSNYAMTYLSLAASLNMDYVDSDLAKDYGAIDRIIDNPSAIRRLQEHGYTYVHFESETTGRAPLADVSFSRGRFESEFERVLFETTLLGTIMPPRPRHEAVINAFEDLAAIPSDPAPTFTFAHLLVPHPPFMFAADGGLIPYHDDLAAEFEREPYVNQLRFINSKVVELVDQLLMASPREPVIIIQGDHGPAAFLTDTASREQIYWERHAILNAMLVPGDLRRDVYDSISPVNTFRLLLKGLFRDELDLLPDRAFYSWYFNGNHAAVEGDSLQLREITDELP